MPLYGEPGERIGYAVHPGRAGGPPILLIHGFTASSASFYENLPGLSAQFTVVTVDLLGHGASDAPEAPEAYAPALAVERILGLLDELGIDRVLLCGHSLGGALALRLALDAPERVAGLIVINSNSAAGTPEWRDQTRPGMAQMAGRVRDEGHLFLRRTRIYPAHSKRLPPGARELLIRDFEATKPAGIAGTAEGLVVDVNAYERHGDLTVPTLLVVGELDHEFVKNAPAFLGRIPEGVAEMTLLAGAGHAANLERPAEFEHAVVAFAERIGYLGHTAAEPKRSSRDTERIALTALGALMVLGGFGMVVAAFTFGRDGGTTRASGGIEATATATAIDAVSGVRTPGTPGLEPTPTRSLTPARTVTTTPTMASPTATPATQEAPAAAVTRNAPAPTATPSPTPAATATTPAKPVYAALSGPTAVPPGGTATYVDTSNPERLTIDWAFPGGTRGNTPSVSVTFPSTPGCYPVSLTAYFPLPVGVQTASLNVTVGDATCP